MRKFTVKEFITKAQGIHGSTYDYSFVEYINTKSKVKIICRIHGEFFQAPDKHLMGRGCSKCGLLHQVKARTETTAEFIDRSNKIHNNYYDYSQVLYNNTHTDVTIICNKHGSFNQSPMAHLQGQGCPICGVEKQTAQRTKLPSKFLQDAIFVHGNKYNYSMTVYKNSKTEIIIICPEHGTFVQIPSDHLAGRGCKTCSLIKSADARRKSTAEFIERANIIHQGIYDYSLSEYTGADNSIVIICKEHGQFEQIVSNHLAGHGCKLCVGRVSKLETDWLNSINIPKENRQKFIKIENKKIYVDAFDPGTNTIYEFYGDLWHGNPKVYKPNDINFKNKINFGVLYNKTIKREILIKDAGYSLVTMWEYDFRKQIKENKNNEII